MKHVHRWRIESPGKGKKTLQGHCSGCGLKREFAAAAPDPDKSKLIANLAKRRP